MLKRVFLSILVIITATAALPHQAERSRNDWLRSLLHSLDGQVPLSGHPIPEGERFARGREQCRLAIHNINRFLESQARSGEVEHAAGPLPLEWMAGDGAGASGAIAGTIVEKGGGPVQAHVQVYVFDEVGRFSGSDYVSSSENSYSVPNLRPGRYYVKTQSTAYQDVYFRNTTDWRRAKLVRVGKNKIVRGINFKMRVIPHAASISGWVKGKNGRTLEECKIHIYDTLNNYVLSASTDDLGAYRAELPGGDYKLRCEYSGSANFVDAWYGGTAGFETAEVVHAIESQTMENINFVLDIGGTIKGRVICHDGRAAWEYECYVLAYDAEKRFIDAAVTSSTGRFSLPRLRKGSYRLRIKYHGSYNNLDGWYKNAENFTGAAWIRVNPGRSKQVKIKLRPGGIVSGNVRDYNGRMVAEDCYIWVVDEMGENVRDGGVDGNGAYAIPSLPTGSYRIRADYFGSYPVLGQEPADEWYSGAYAFENAAAIRVKAPQTTSGIDFHLKQGGRITGIIRGPGGEPLESASIRLYSLKGESMETGYVKSDGSYTVTGLPTGEYKLRASYYRNENYQPQWYRRKNNLIDAESVSVTAPEPTSGIDFTMEYPGVLQGYLTDRSGDRLTNAGHAIQLYTFDADSGEYIDSTSVSFNGGYQFRLLGGKYKLAAASFYFNWMPFGEDELAVTYFKKGGRPFASNTLPIWVGAGATRKLPKLVMRKAGGSISGRLYDKTGAAPLTDGNFMIMAFDEFGYLVKASAYSSVIGPMDGGYRVAGLRPGIYYLLAWSYKDYDFEPEFGCQWYNGVEAAFFDPEWLVPKMDIPSTAYAVIVGKGETAGIDFHLKLDSQ